MDRDLSKQFTPGTTGVAVTPPAEMMQAPSAPVIMQVAHYADEIKPWGTGVKTRDAELRSFWSTEPILASAVYSMAAKISVLDWEIVGADPSKTKPRNTINRVEQLLNTTGGIGLQRTLMKLMIDLYTQDNGAFLEIIRESGSESAPVVGLRHLDAARCYRTGDPAFPIYYLDANSTYHKMPWYSVISFEEMPSPVEEMFDVQYCAVTRVLRYAQLLRDISIYKKEKVSGRNPGAIHLINGMSQRELEAARLWAEENQLNQELFRYIAPYLIGTINPEANLQHVEIAMASLPDAYSEDDTLKWYFTIIALGFGTDYQEFAPLASTNMGSGQQSEVLHMKSRGKGPAAVIKLIETAFNFQGVLPSNVRFKFIAQDLQLDEGKANARFLRAKDLSLRIDAGTISKKQAAEISFLDGDLPEHLLAERLAELEEEERQQEEQPDMPVDGTPMEDRNADPTTAEQIQGGMDRQGPVDATQKSTPDDMRTDLIAQLQRRDELRITDNPVELTADDIPDTIGKRFVRRLKNLFGGTDALDES